MGKSIAILGASRDRSKFGNKAVRAYIQAGWTVYPLNPRETMLEALPCYPALAAVPQPLDRISVYLPPGVGQALLPEIAATPHGELWLNPGSQSPALLAEAERIGLKPIQACSIVDIGLSPALFGDD